LRAQRVELRGDEGRERAVSTVQFKVILEARGSGVLLTAVQKPLMTLKATTLEVMLAKLAAANSVVPMWPTLTTVTTKSEYSRK